MKTLIEAPFLLAGDEMRVLKEGYVLIDGHIILEVGEGDPPPAEKRIRKEESIIIPGLINSHIHIGDSAFKDIGFGKTLDELFKPPNGLKHKLLRNSTKDVILSAIKDSLREMISSGTTTFADFREGSIAGVKILLEALKEQYIRALIFSRPDSRYILEKSDNEQIPTPQINFFELQELMKIVHGLAPSSPNDSTDEMLRQFVKITKQHKKLRVTHAVESPNSDLISKKRTGFTEVQRAIYQFEADLLVHLTYASQEDLRLVAKRETPVVVCPRANASLGLKLPPVPEMLDRNIPVCLGTDNVMINQPNIFREMEFTLKAYRMEKATSRSLKPMEILYMATINGARALKIDAETGSIREGKSADLVIIDLDKNLKNTQDLPTALVHRAGTDDINLVFFKGEIVYDRNMGKFSRKSSYNNQQ